MAFNLFVSNTVREFRASVGDPDVIVSAHRLDAGGAELRVSFSSALEEGRLEGFRWPLHPLDDVAGLTASIRSYLDECRLRSVRFVDIVLPDQFDNGSAFVTVRRFDEVSRGAVQH